MLELGKPYRSASIIRAMTWLRPLQIAAALRAAEQSYRA